MNPSFTFVARGSFFSEKRTESYKWYGEGSIAAKKLAIARKGFQRTQLSCVAGKAGV